jgi:Calcineurin-like phosphoesterase
MPGILKAATLLALFSTASQVSALRLAQINDIHVNLAYNYSCSFPLCLDLGNYAMDAPIKLVDTVLGDLKYYYDTASEPVDAVLLAGDFVVHGLSNSDPEFKNWPEMKRVISAIIDSVKAKFPNTPIIPTIGNNDLLNHY